MEPIVWVILVVLLVALLAAAIVATSRKRRRAQLQQRFGPEYERAVVETGSRREAEQHLASVAERRDQLEIRELEPQQRARFVEQWEAVQARFVDEPAGAVDDADTLLTTVLRERGYPVDHFEERAELIATDHPEVVEHYRAAHASHERHRATGAADTEDLRQSFVHYRSLFDAVVGRSHGHESHGQDTHGQDTGDASDEQVQRADRSVEMTDSASPQTPAESGAHTTREAGR